MNKNKKAKRLKNKEKSSDVRVEKNVWLYGIHTVRDALKNKNRIKHRLMITPNAYRKLEGVILKSSVKPEVINPHKFDPPLEKNAVHQGVALEVTPLFWGSISQVCKPNNDNNLVLVLDKVTDPQNVGAILRSAEVFGAAAVVTQTRNSAPETGALAKAASGTLERQPYLRLPNLARALATLKQMGFICIGLDGTSNLDIGEGLRKLPVSSIALIVGAEGSGLRELTKKNCDNVLRIPSQGNFGSLNVSNAAAIALFASRSQLSNWQCV